MNCSLDRFTWSARASTQGITGSTSTDEGKPVSQPVKRQRDAAGMMVGIFRPVALDQCLMARHRSWYYELLVCYLNNGAGNLYIDLVIVILDQGAEVSGAQTSRCLLYHLGPESLVGLLGVINRDKDFLSRFTYIDK